MVYQAYLTVRGKYEIDRVFCGLADSEGNTVSAKVSSDVYQSLMKIWGSKELSKLNYDIEGDVNGLIMIIPNKPVFNYVKRQMLKCGLKE